MSIETVRLFLREKGFEDRIREFGVSSATVNLAAQAVGCEPARIAKTLSFLVDGRCVLIVAAGDAKIDNSKYKAQFHTKAKMLTPEQALRDPRRNVLLQCIGASKVVEPDFLFGRFEGEECCLLCSDGFRHVITEQELQSAFSPANNLSQEAMKQHLTAVTEWNKQRQETDNISAILIRMR